MAQESRRVGRERAGDGRRGKEDVRRQTLLVGQCNGHAGGGGGRLQGRVDEGLPDKRFATQLPTDSHGLEVLDVVRRVLVVFDDLLDDLIVDCAGTVLCSLPQQDGVFLPCR